ncbi:MAG: hypothetical protein JJE44_03735 [Flavobacteriaceae bacterium]|nr:hypothetical protein [Flavobacteriaceae bacterium]
MNRKKIKVFIVCFSFMLIGVVAYSGTPPPPGDPALPIDGGVSLLLLSGVAYGIFELKRKK